MRKCRSHTRSTRPALATLIASLAVLLVFAGPLAAQHRDAGAPKSPEVPATENLRAFAKLYGYVRWFHPSDEAAATDWDRFAIHGARRVRDAATPPELREALEELFHPIAPTVRIYEAGEAPGPVDLAPPDTTGLRVVAWQHRGVGLRDGGWYRSIRLNRPDPGAEPELQVLTEVDAEPLLGGRVRLSAEARMTPGSQDARLVLVLVVGTRSGRGFRDLMADRPITSGEWNRYEIVGPVARNATELTLGAVMQGTGEAALRNLRLEVEEDGSWREVGGIDDAFASLAGPSSGEAAAKWTVERDEGEHRVEVIERPGGEPVLALALHRPAPAEPLVPEHPRVGEVTEAALARGLRARVPLALWSDRERTYPAASAGTLDRLQSALEAVDPATLGGDDLAVRFADVVIAWNVLQHFYPYFDAVDADWDVALSEALAGAERDEGTLDFHRTLTRMLHHLGDGHGDAFHPHFREWRGLPLRVDWIDNQVVVVASEDTAVARPGDVVLSLDRTPAWAWLQRTAGHFSGSDLWRRHRALTHPFRGFGRGEAGTEATLVLVRDGRVLERVVMREAERIPPEPRPESFREVAEDVVYVDLVTTRFAEVERRIEALAAARGVIFDLRGHPADNDVRLVVGYLAADTLLSGHWNTPYVLYPDRERIVGWDSRGRWKMPPREPRLQNTVVFLSDPSAVSFPEGILGMVEAYGLAEIVGQPTAGATGNANPFSLPGGFRVNWTGMKYLKPDSSQHHMVGVRPTVPVTRSIEAVREGRDEYIERAVELIRSSRRQRARGNPRTRIPQRR